MQIFSPNALSVAIKILIIHLAVSSTLIESVSRRRYARALLSGDGAKRSVSAPLMAEPINLETIEGVDEVTKLVLLKTDSLPGESEANEKIGSRYLNSLMETLYTGLRKPFKSVSADILGIFPSFEEVQVRCKAPPASVASPLIPVPGSGQLERDESLLSDDQRQQYPAMNLNNNNNNNTLIGSETFSTETNNNRVSSMQVCQAVTNDCLSIEELIAMLPPSVTTFDAALVRLCPLMLFRIMNQVCKKPSDSLYSKQAESASLEEPLMQEQSSSDSVQQQQSSSSSSNQIATNAQQSVNATNGSSSSSSSSISLSSTLQILRNLQNSDMDPISGQTAPKNRPQKLHKKLKTQTNKNGRLVVGGSSQMNQLMREQYGVDQQLLKIRLKLSEPSIEKVWIFSLLFVVLSIVVSMGGLIVLPFVKKTTRRRILTLFEGLAVGGLAGSATLHMFPQAFGLVDENYHKYFWRIFVVFMGIYLCYLCERIIKILKVVRARRKRRSRASLIERGDQRRDRSRCRLMVMLILGGMARFCQIIRQPISKFAAAVQNFFDFFRSVDIVQSSSSRASDASDDLEATVDARHKFEWTDDNMVGQSHQNIKGKKKKYSVRFSSLQQEVRRTSGEAMQIVGQTEHRVSDDDEQDCEINLNMLASSGEGLDNSAQRQRLIKCLESVQHQFSPVYAVYLSNSEDRYLSESDAHSINNARAKHRSKRGKRTPRGFHESMSDGGGGGGGHDDDDDDDGEGRPAFWKRNVLFERWQAHAKASKMRRQMKQREIETMLYHKHRMEQQLRMQQLLEEQQRRARRKQLRRQQRQAQLEQRSVAGSPIQRKDSLDYIVSNNNLAPATTGAPLELGVVLLDPRIEEDEQDKSFATVKQFNPNDDDEDDDGANRDNIETGVDYSRKLSASQNLALHDEEAAQQQAATTTTNANNNTSSGSNTTNTNANNNKKEKPNNPANMRRLTNVSDVAGERQDQDNAARMSVDTVAWMIVFGDAVLNVIDGLSIGAAFERNLLAGISISVAVMLEEVTHRLGTFAVLIRAGMSMQQSLLCTFLSACALFPGLIVGILLSDATEDATPYIFCAAGGIFLYMALVDVMKEMNRSIENAIRKDIKSTLQIFALQNVGIILAVIFLSFLALYEQAMDFEEYQMQYNQPL